MDWPTVGLGGGYSGFDTGHPVIMVVIPVVIVKKTAVVLPVWGRRLVLKIKTAAGTMTG